jgi:hypothetical protein
VARGFLIGSAGSGGGLFRFALLEAAVGAGPVLGALALPTRGLSVWTRTSLSERGLSVWTRTSLCETGLFVWTRTSLSERGLYFGAGAANRNVMAGALAAAADILEF